MDKTIAEGHKSPLCFLIPIFGMNERKIYESSEESKE